jgi:hypothetical protein
LATYDPKKPLISIHIPKCAGTSFTAVLREWFGNSLLLHYFNERWNIPPRRYALKRIFSNEFKEGLCIHGHFNRRRGVGVEDYYPEVRQFITVMRDPFDLHLSNYFYLKRGQSTDSGEHYQAGRINPVAAENWTLAEFLGRKKTSYIRNFLPEQVTLNNYRELLDEYYLAIGVMDDLQRSVDHIALVLGFPSVAVEHRNISDWDEDIPAGAREEFIRNNPLEMAVYQYALEKLPPSEKQQWA